MLSQPEKIAAYHRVRGELGIGRMGRAQDAPPLPPRGGQTAKSGAGALAIEAQMAGVQMYEFGEIWSRPGLSLRIRCFITLAALTALRDMDQLYRYINSALNIGITPEEVHEALLHAGVYGGMPAWESAVRVAREVFIARGMAPADMGVAIDPKPQMTPDERDAAMRRVTAELNIGRVGRGADAPLLKPLAGGLQSVGDAINMPIASEFARLNGGHGFGEVWGRPALDLRTRAFMTVAVLQVLVETHEMTIHINNALNLGITPEEVYEGLGHAGIYGGLSGWHNATLVAAHVFAQHRSLQISHGAA